MARLTSNVCLYAVAAYVAIDMKGTLDSIVWGLVSYLVIKGLISRVLLNIISNKS